MAIIKEESQPREDVRIEHSFNGETVKSPRRGDTECFAVAILPERVEVDGFAFRFRRKTGMGYEVPYDLRYPMAEYYTVVATNTDGKKPAYPDGLCWKAHNVREDWTSRCSLVWRLDSQQWKIRLSSTSTCVELHEDHLSHNLLRTIFLWNRDFDVRRCKHNGPLNEVLGWIQHCVEGGKVLSIERPFTLWDWRNGFRDNPGVEAESKRRHMALQQYMKQHGDPSYFEPTFDWEDFWFRP